MPLLYFVDAESACCRAGAGFCHPCCEAIEAVAVLGAECSSFVLEGLWLQKMLPEGPACVRLETFHQLCEDSGKQHGTLGLREAGEKKAELMIDYYFKGIIYSAAQRTRGAKMSED